LDVKRLLSRTLVLAVVAFGIFWLVVDRALSLVLPAGKVIVTADQAFRPGARGMLDVYQPEGASAAPVVLFFYGGSWQMGSRGLYEFVGKTLARRGIVTMVADYRLYPEVRFPVFLEDGAAATAWAKANAARFGGDPRRLFLMGHSAGAHTAAMLAFDPQWLGSIGLDPKRDLAGMVGLSGPYDFGTLTRKDLIDVFGGPNRAETHPINFVTPGAPPAFLGTGTSDKTVSDGNTSRLASRMRQNGVEVREAVYPGGHFRIILSFLRPLSFLGTVADDVAGYVIKQPNRAQR
jgi:acetyl esterase/lipase